MKYLAHGKKSRFLEMLKHESADYAKDRLLTMFLPTFREAIEYMKDLLHDMWFVVWFDKPRLLFKGMLYYAAPRGKENPLHTVALYELPRIINGRITLRCCFPGCKSKIVLRNPDERKQNDRKAMTIEHIHTCLHDNKTYPLLSIREPDNTVAWATVPEENDFTARPVLNHNDWDLFCFNAPVKVRLEVMGKKDIKKLY
ncbi:MAG: hypothetical protein IPK55_14965 [Streptococcus sp.]|nr:hypothetical protein [Streptococcus sp.]